MGKPMADYVKLPELEEYSKWFKDFADLYREDGILQVSWKTKNLPMLTSGIDSMRHRIDSLGRVYYNQAVKMNEDAAYINDKKQYNKALAEMKAMFKQSLPFFEQAHALEPDNTDYMRTLKALYYRFIDEPGMQDKYDAIVNELGY